MWPPLSSIAALSRPILPLLLTCSFCLPPSDWTSSLLFIAATAHLAGRIAVRAGQLPRKRLKCLLFSMTKTYKDNKKFLIAPADDSSHTLHSPQDASRSKTDILPAETRQFYAGTESETAVLAERMRNDEVVRGVRFCGSQGKILRAAAVPPHLTSFFRISPAAAGGHA